MRATVRTSIPVITTILILMRRMIRHRCARTSTRSRIWKRSLARRTIPSLAGASPLCPPATLAPASTAAPMLTHVMITGTKTTHICSTSQPPGRARARRPIRVGGWTSTGSSTSRRASAVPNPATTTIAIAMVTIATIISNRHWTFKTNKRVRWLTHTATSTPRLTTSTWRAE